MIKNKKLIFGLSVCFLMLEAALGVLLQTAQSEIGINLRYTAVILAAAFCVTFAEKSKAFIFTQVALICTVGADYFLVYLPDMKQLPAMIFFSVTQIAYFLRLYFDDENLKRRKIHLALRVAISVAILCVTVAVLGKKCDAVAIVSMFYYSNLILNVVFAFVSFKNNHVFAIGLLLFVLCDTVVGFSFIDGYLPISESSFIYKIIHPGFDLAWAFYLPSQTLLAISLLPNWLKANKEMPFA